MFKEYIQKTDWMVNIVLVNDEGKLSYLPLRYGDLEKADYDGVLYSNAMINRSPVFDTKGKIFKAAVKAIHEASNDERFVPPLFVAAGYYGEGEKKHFGIVGPGGVGRYYVGVGEYALSLCSHHSGLYFLCENGMIQGVDSPRYVMSNPGEVVKLTDQQICDIQQSMQNGLLIWR